MISREQAIAAMEGAAVTPAGEYMRAPSAARLQHLALCHLETLMQRRMTAEEARQVARIAASEAIEAAYREITGKD